MGSIGHATCLLLRRYDLKGKMSPQSEWLETTDSCVVIFIQTYFAFADLEYEARVVCPRPPGSQ